MHPLSTPNLIARRLADNWKLLLSIFFGIAVAATLVAGAPIYIKTLERQGINTAIDRESNDILNMVAFAPHLPVTRTGLEGTDDILDEAIESNVSGVYRGRERYVKTPTYLVGIPRRPLSNQRGVLLARGYFQALTNLEGHITFADGHMAGDEVVSGPEGPEVEALLGNALANGFGLSVGDVLTLTPSLGEPLRISAKIVGTFDATDPTAEYWQGNAKLFIEPRALQEPPDPGIAIDPDAPPLALFITQEAMINAVGTAYPGSLAHSTWFILVDKERLKGWSASESRQRLDNLENKIANAMPGSTLLTGIRSLMDDFDRRSFLSSVPLLLLLTVMVVTVAYYLSMMVSYLVQSRESDVALLKSRGVSTLRLLRLYALEGLVLTVVAVIIAPFLAMGAIAIAGKLPYFKDITGGAILPVEFHWMPFLAAAGAGVLALAIFVLPALLAARTGLVIHRLRSSRPPSVPLFQRYYLDVAMLAVGGLIFWELRERGQFVSGGLFQNVQVNEALLLAPVLFLTVVALLFMRFFPLFVRFISGDSPALLHLLTVATVVTLGPAIAAREIRDDGGLSWVAPTLMVVAFALLYQGTERASRRRSRLLGLALQATIVGLFVIMEPPETDDISFVPTMSLIAILPARGMFELLRTFSHVAPVWVSMGLWHMARNPLQYSWLVLLLVMVTGLGLLATTVGGTLDQSHRERVLYDVAADIRVRGAPGHFAQGRLALKETYLTIPGVTSVSLGLRGGVDLGTSRLVGQYDVLALESQDFPYISWYRDDFSSLSLRGVMRALQGPGQTDRMEIPKGATTLGVWAKPEEVYSNISLWVVIQDARGITETVSLGRLEDTEWRLMSGHIPIRLEHPLEVVSVQIYEPGFGPTGTPGSVRLDNLHVVDGTDGEEHLLDDFEGDRDWVPLTTSRLSSDRLASTTEDTYDGRRSGLFSFGKETDRGIRGFYRSLNGGVLPVVASSSFTNDTGTNIGDVVILKILGHTTPVLIRDTVDYFPTLNPRRSGFLLADLASLLRHLNILSPLTQITPNELFIAQAPGAGESVLEVVNNLSRHPYTVYDKRSMLESVRLDPLVTAGWKAMVLLSLAVIVITAGFGYVTYLLAFGDRSRGEMSFLQTLGLTRRQMAGLLTMEHLIIVTIGIGLGTWAGLQMSRIMVSSVAVTDTGQRVVPPFILTTDWGFMIPIYVVLAAIFLGGLYRLVRAMLRLDLRSISRVEG